MLTKFEVTNFKNFNTKLSFDLTKTKNYEFNEECLINGVVNNALIYGHNAVGKSNLGFAIFDIISHLTDKNSHKKEYENYLNACNQTACASFLYEFRFGDDIVLYEYQKENIETIVFERLQINGNVYALLDRNKDTIAQFNAKGSETLDKDIGESKISIISYLEKNSLLKKDAANKLFREFLDFVNKMLFFRSLEKNEYLGFHQGTRTLIKDIIKNDNLDDLQLFFNDAGIQCQLGTVKENEEDVLAFDFGCKKIPFTQIASKGTRSLLLFYYWYQYMRNSASNKARFIFIDEFDAFYHHSLSSLIVEKLRHINAQVILTTHNTSVITNDLLRPDCYYLLNDSGICSLANRTRKELREANNIEKMFIAGKFDV